LKQEPLTRERIRELAPVLSAFQDMEDALKGETVDPQVIYEFTALGITLVTKLLEHRTGKPIAELSGAEMLAEIAAAKAAVTDSAEVYADALAGKL
jgi:hypothetical protein